MNDQVRCAQHDVSDEEIHAFIDDELTLEDRQRIRRAIKHKPELAQMVCDADQVRDWVREAYQTVPEVRRARARGRLGAFLPTAVAAILLLLVGATAGWFAGQSAQAGKATEAPTLSRGSATTLPLQSAAHTRNVLLRLSSDDPHKFHETLKVAESLLKKAGHQPGFELEVLANSDGLNFLRADKSPYARQIEALIKKYPNVHFLVCGTSLANLKKQGQKPDLLPHVQVTPSAVERVVQRLREGWTYYSI